MDGDIFVRYQSFKVHNIGLVYLVQALQAAPSPDAQVCDIGIAIQPF